MHILQIRAASKRNVGSPRQAISAMCLNSLYPRDQDPHLNLTKKTLHSHRNLIPNLHLRISANLFVQLLDTRLQLRNRFQIKITVQMPEERARDPDEWPVGILDFALLDDLERGRVDHDLVQTGHDQPAGEVLDLLARLDEEVPAWRHLDCDALARVACPDVQARVARAAMDRPERRKS